MGGDVLWKTEDEERWIEDVRMCGFEEGKKEGWLMIIFRSGDDLVMRKQNLCLVALIKSVKYGRDCKASEKAGFPDG